MKIPLIIFTLVLLLGCQTEPTEIISHNFKQGYSGVTISFLDNAPPAQIYPNSDFNIMIMLENDGAYDVMDGKVTLLGLEDTYFSITPLERDFDGLLGRTLTNPAGDQMILAFQGRSGNLFQNADHYSNNYFVDLSYDSSLEFSDTICINYNLYSTYDQGCEINEKNYNGQGAPLAVTNLQQIVSPGIGMEFRLILENKGRGKVGEVLLRRARLGGEPIECQFQNEVANLRRTRFMFDEMEKTVLCKSPPATTTTSYTTTFSVDFDYGYSLVQQENLYLLR